MDDQTLLQKCRNRDLEAWHVFFRRMSPLARKSILYKLSNLGLAGRRDIADDILQEIFHSIWEKDKLTGVRDARSLAGWVAIVSMNTTINWCKKHIFREEGRCTSLEKTLFADDPRPAMKDLLSCRKGDTMSDLGNRELNAVIKKELDLLPSRQKLALKFNLYDGLKHREIAEIMNAPVNTISTLISRAKRTIAARLEKLDLGP